MSHILPSLAAAWRSAATASSSAASSSSCRRCIRALQTGTSSSSYTHTRSRRSYASSTSSSSASPPTSVESPTLATNQPPSSPSQAGLQKSATKTPRPKSKEKGPKAAKVEQQPPPTAEAHFRTEHELHAISSRTRRIVLSNPDTAKEIVQKMNLQTPDMVVMEIYCGGCSIEFAILMEGRILICFNFSPGSGLLSSELLKLPNVKQVIGVEDYPKFTKPLHVGSSMPSSMIWTQQTHVVFAINLAH